MTKVYEIIKQSLDNCTRMTEASKVDEATRVANKIVKLKDNPVPSIDNTIEWILSLNVPQVFTHELRQDIIEKLEELQNGVETNKEQP